MYKWLGTFKVGKYTKIHHEPETEEDGIPLQEYFMLVRTSPDESITFFETYLTLREALLASRELSWK